MNVVSQTRKGQKGRWLRVTLLTSVIGVPAIRASLERLRQPEMAEKAQTIQDGAYAMQTDTMERLDALSQESQKKLHKQIERVQEEAKQLRAQARKLRRAQHAEAKKRKKLVEQMVKSSKTLGQSVRQRGGELTAAANSQLKSGQQMALERGSNLLQGMSQRGSELTANAGSQLKSGQQMMLERGGNLWQEISQRGSEALTDWRDGASHKLREQGRPLGRYTSDLGDGTSKRRRKHGGRLGQNASDWGDETTHQLRKQGQHLVQNVADWKDDTAYQLRKQGQQMVRNLADRRDDAAHELRKQKRHMSQNVAERRGDVTHNLRKQGRSLSRNINERQSKIWPFLGFIFGVLLAGGLTYWLVKHNIGKHHLEEEEQIELQTRDMLNGASGSPGGEIRYASQGGAAVATRPSATSAEPLNKFVGVLSTRQYYPIEQKPQAHDLVFFESEDDARAEGFTSGY